MSNKRKDMWMLLYNLVNRTDTDLNEVFSFVDDILCKEPSLIRSYSTRILDNHFQDAFLTWLINKLVSYFNQQFSEGLYLANINLQKRILTSCLVNRSILFKKLVLCYASGISTLSSSLDITDQDTIVELNSFVTEDQCMKDIDAETKYQLIHIRSTDIDRFILSFLDIMMHAISVGHHEYPQLFSESIANILQAFREGETEIKLKSLQYCSKLFQSALELDDLLEYCYYYTLQALTTLWEQMPIWLHADCIEIEDIETFADISSQILNEFSRFEVHTKYDQDLSQMALNILNNISVIRKCKVPKRECVSVLLDLQHSIILFLRYLHRSPFKASWFDDDQTAALLDQSQENSGILFVISAGIGASESLFPKTLLTLRKNLAWNLEKKMTSMNDFEYLKALLHSLYSMELYHLRHRQLSSLRDKSILETTFSEINYEKMYCLVEGDTQNDKERLLDEQIQNFLNNVKQSEGSHFYAQYIEVVGHLLRIELFKRLLKPKILDQLISFVTRPLMDYLDLEIQKNREISHVAIRTLSSISFDANNSISKHLSQVLNRFVMRIFNPASNSTYVSELRTAFFDNVKGFIISGSLTIAQIFKECFQSLKNNSENLARVLPSICWVGNCLVFRVSNISCNTLRNKHEEPLCFNEIICEKCTPFQEDIVEFATEFLKRNEAYILKWPCEKRKEKKDFELELLPLLKECLPKSFLKDEKFNFLFKHFTPDSLCDISLINITQTNNMRAFNIRIFQLYVQRMSHDVDLLLQTISKFLLSQTNQSLNDRSLPMQLQVLEMISFSARIDGISEKWLYHLFKTTFFYLMHPDSLVVHEAILVATEMCYHHNIKPTNLWHWYKRDALNLIVKLALYVYLKNGVRLTRSLRPLTKMLGFSCVQEFICKYYRLLSTMILPYCVKEPRCKGCFVAICKVTRKSIAQIFVASFLRIYTHIYLTEDDYIADKCIDMVLRCTSLSLQKLMSTDIKQTVSEFLIYFNRMPKFVMQAFQCLIMIDKPLPKNSAVDLVGSQLSTDFAKFIVDRFLGVITYFQSCLGDQNFEKSLKEEAMYSLGQIIRFVGAKHVTQFRFKIIAMLAFVLTLNDKNLQNICLKIWMIFLKIVDIQELGPSVSRIVACLQPLLKSNAVEVNSIYEYIILKNDILLGAHIPDLYFVEHLPAVEPKIRRSISRQMDIVRKEKSSTSDKLQFLYSQITKENVEVRIYGLIHLSLFIANNRAAINLMILEEIRIDPLLQKIVDVLLVGCRHEDRNLQLESAKCLGELGAIDPSYMPSNSYLQVNEMALSIHTDKFAIMALTELCRAYQFQKDSKYVDNFSLAIQEILLMCGASSKGREEVAVWNALPEPMRKIMEPFLTSCYTASCRDSNCKEHPIFKSVSCHSYQEWAFSWASRLINFVQTNETHHLLKSFRPSIKRDGKTLVMLFPYIILHALQECSDAERQQIIEEFQAVFECGSRGVMNKLPEYETSGMKEFMSTKYSIGSKKVENEQKNRQDTTFDVVGGGGDITIACVKLCSEQIDFLHRWQLEWKRTNIATATVEEASEHYKSIERFTKELDKHLIAKANYNSGEFSRALMYLESYIEEDVKNRLQEQLSFLIEIHGSLRDADSVEGAVYMKKSNLLLTEEIFVNSLVDRPQETISCYEQLISKGEEFQQEHIAGMINSYLRMEVPETALLLADGLWQKFTEQYTDDYFKECKSELLWRLCRYEELQDILDDPVVRRKATNWNVQCSEAFLMFRQPNSEHDLALDKFCSQIDGIRGNILNSMRTFSGVTYNSYSNSYDEVIKLHLLREIEKCKVFLNGLDEAFVSNADISSGSCMKEVNEFFNDWDSRLCILKPDVRVVEPILCFRRNLLTETKKVLTSRQGCSNANDFQERIIALINDEIGKLWIRSAQMNREAGGLQQAHLSIMKAEEYEPKMLFLEKAKLFWEKGDHKNTFKLIEENLERIEMKCEGNIRNLEAIDRALYAEAKFLQASYNAKSMNICSELNLRYFTEAIAGNKRSEKCYVHLAHYMEKIFESFTSEQKDSERGQTLVYEIMLNYARSLKYGFENVYQSMPRLLSLWLDFTARCAALNDGAAGDASFSELARKMNDLIQSCISLLPTSLFYTAFSQLLSRICHPSMDVFNVLRNIIIKLLLHYPHQSLWMLLPSFKSSNTTRVKRCRLIFTDNRLASPEFQKLLTDFNMLTERLIELTNKEVVIQRTYELSSLVRQLPKLFADPSFSQILLPFEKYMQISLPILSASMSQKLHFPTGREESLSTASVPTNPFPYKQIYIIGIKEEVIVLRSAAKPKKIIIECSDGVSYEVMVKPKDDMRKDFRLMEFNGLVKRCLHQDSQARHRRLHIRTYAAIPFNEDCGFVEWLPRLDSFRNICSSIYRTRGLGIEDRHLRKLALPKTDPIEKKRSVFIGTLLARHPPVFHEWFRQRFPTPHSWYEARSSYVKSVAVMSMVGYILGLGDRHGENILFDESSGEVVHVDFSCLFNQGENFAYPELVPFRLTHNMVFAMGPLGVEGMYRKSCEITLRVLKKESKTLMSLLRPFVYDFQNRTLSNRKITEAELTDPKAMHDVRRIEDRLQGYVNKTLGNSIPLSVEGQVSFLIKEAIDIDNLAAMYIGWGSYI